MKTIGVIIPNYNSGTYIRKCLDSLLEQEYKVNEIIVVDDCSTDDSPKIVKEYIQQYALRNWRIYLNDCNLGYKGNFQKGIELATGKYIFLCDQDDEWERNKIELMTQVMSDNPQIQALNCGVRLIDGNSEEIEYRASKNKYNCGFLYSEQPIGKISYYSSLLTET